MAVIDTVMVTAHLLFAALLTGSVLFAAVAIVPLAAGGSISNQAVALLVSSLRNLSRLSGLFLVLSGGYMAMEYTVGSLTGSGDGHLVLTMIVLWILITALVEVGGSRVGTERGLGNPATRRLFYLAGLAAVLVLLDAGVIVASEF